MATIESTIFSKYFHLEIVRNNNYYTISIIDQNSEDEIYINVNNIEDFKNKFIKEYKRVIGGKIDG